MGEIKHIFEKVLDVLFPQNIKCMFCGEEVNESEFCLCDKCAQTVERCEKVCDCCGSVLKSESKYCLICLNNKREFDFARAPYVYKGKVIAAVHNFKYNGAKYLAKPFAKSMLSSFNELNSLIGGLDFIIPVPMHKSKLKKRKYNQSKLLADEISKLTNLPVYDDLVVKVKNTESQTKLSRQDRFKNMKDVFVITDKGKVKGKNILIVDDILTTGATTESMVKLLKTNHANKIAVLSFARTDADKVSWYHSGIKIK